MFTKKDIEQIRAQHISLTDIEQQLDNFKNGFPFLKLSESAKAGHGITQLNPNQQADYLTVYEQWDGQRTKFVPASGAATRMFKGLYEALQKMESDRDFDWNEKVMSQAKDFFDNINKFAFYEKLKQVASKNNLDIDNLKKNDFSLVLHLLLDSNGLNYGSLPKGLLYFHRYGQKVRTAFEEHLMEAALYAKTHDGTAHLHFTVSPEHRAEFEKLLKNVLPLYQQQYDVKYKVRFSEQKKLTDTIAVDMDNQPFRNDNGSLLFRPAGHGALLENLNETDGDIIFIKNIDNVVPEHHVHETVYWKKILAGLLVEKQKIVFDYLKEWDKGTLDKDKTEEIKKFLSNTFLITLPITLTPENTADYLFHMLNRPIRVCGMVKNEGEPGGGPFIANNSDGSLSPQIAEPQQIDMNDPIQYKILQESTHFNPVDIVCAPKNYKGEKFDLLKYRDDTTGFISIKSKDGKDLKAQELPGLWNGAMSNLNTIFVEIPLITFNPVKTVNDLLRKEHQE